MERRRKIALGWAVAVTVVLLAGAAVVGFALTGSSGPAAAGPGACSSGPGPRQVTVYFDSDVEMRAAAEKLRGDERIADLDSETRGEAWQRFKVIFADQSVLVELVRPESLPSAVWVVPADEISPEELTKRLVDELPAADDVVPTPCPMPTTGSSAPPTVPS